jgi:hypothetical protein
VVTVGVFAVLHVLVFLARRHAFPGDSSWLDQLGVGWAIARSLVDALHLWLWLATFLATPALLERMFRRSGDNAAATGWSAPALAARYPRLVHKVLPWVPSVAFLIPRSLHVWHMFLYGGLSYLARASDWLVPELAGVALAIPLLAWATKRAIAWQLGDVRAGDETEGATGATAEREDSFAAVAVTPATRAVVGGLGAVSVAMVAYTAFSGIDPTAAVVVYVVGTLGATAAFRRVSRITVGIDGVLVRGAGKTRFFPYAGVDDVREQAGSILVSCDGRVVLRLQLHDADTARAATLVQRFKDAMERAARARSEGAERVMDMARASPRSSSRLASRKLASAAVGGGDYRQAAVTHEQLWELVEGPTADATSRAVAARALASEGKDEARARVRVAADRCADPGVRVALARIAADEEDDEEEVEGLALEFALKRTTLEGR